MRKELSYAVGLCVIIVSSQGAVAFAISSLIQSVSRDTELNISLQDFEVRSDNWIANRANLTQNVEKVRRDAEAGNVVAAKLVALAYLDGFGVAPDLVQGVEWQRRAYVGGSSSSAAQYALDKLTGFGTNKDVAGGLAILDTVRGTITGDAVAGIIKAFGVEVPGDYTLGASLLKSSMDRGSQTAAVFYAICLANGIGVKKDAERAYAIVKRGADESNGLAVKQLAEFTAAGVGVKADVAEVRRLTFVGADLHDATSERFAGEMLLKGKSVARDVTKGLALLNAAS